MISKDKKVDSKKRKTSHLSKQQQKHTQKQHKKSASKECFGGNDLFGSNRFQSNHSKKQSNHRQLQGIGNSHKVITTDQSNNCFESKIHESIFYCENKQPNEQYFQSISLKQKKAKDQDSGNSSRKNSKIKDLSCKLKQMQKLVVSQDKEIAEMKATINQKQLHRLIKMHSIERLKVVSAIKNKTPSKKKNKF